MAKFVIAGKSNCPYYAKAELIGDALAKNLPNFKLHKIVIDPKDWNDWLQRVCTDNDWKHSKSPLIWRELVYRGGKGMLVGDANDFQEYVRQYYTLVSDLMSDDLRRISAENEATHKVIDEEKRLVEASINPMNVTISYPDSRVVYFMVNEMLSGGVFGRNVEVALRLYSQSSSDLEPSSVQGLRMEIEDLASSTLRSIKIVNNGKEAFENCDLAILMDNLKTSNDEDYLNPYLSLAQDIDEYAKSTCKIIVTPFGSRQHIYQLTNFMGKHLKRLEAKKCLMGNSMYDEMCAKAVLGARLKVNPSYIKNVLVIGQSIRDSFYLDVTQGEVTDYDGAVWAKTNSHWRNLIHLVADRDWIKKELLNKINERDNSNDNNYYSAIVNPNENYSIKEDVYFSVPVKFQNGSFNFIPGYKLQSIVEEIVKDTKKRVSNRFQGNKILEDNREMKKYARVKYD